LYAQLELLDEIAAKRKASYEHYRRALKPLEADGLLRLPRIPDGCQSNYHMFYVLLRDRPARDDMLDHLKTENIHAVFHYIPLHSSPMGQKYGYTEKDLPVTNDISGRLLRLPLFYDITMEEQNRVIASIQKFLETR